MTAVTVQSNKTIFNGVKGNEVLLEPSYRKKHNELFGRHNISSERFTLGPAH